MHVDDLYNHEHPTVDGLTVSWTFVWKVKKGILHIIEAQVVVLSDVHWCINRMCVT